MVDLEVVLSMRDSSVSESADSHRILVRVIKGCCSSIPSEWTGTIWTSNLWSSVSCIRLDGSIANHSIISHCRDRSAIRVGLVLVTLNHERICGENHIRRHRRGLH